jgi:hypothetical protein
MMSPLQAEAAGTSQSEDEGVSILSVPPTKTNGGYGKRNYDQVVLRATKEAQTLDVAYHRPTKKEKVCPSTPSQREWGPTAHSRT